MKPIEKILERLEKVKGRDPKWLARCPAHDDNGPSLSLKSLDDGRVLVHCFAGCGASDVMASIGMTLSALYPDGPLGELSGKKYREPENRLYLSGFTNMQAEIHRLRSKLGAV